ncbi:type IV pilus biogenesis protein PilM [Bowmanella pacifica]|uniref:type IV pilus biogenesis protein PilM n=1 Tax=Bowmanella pacifica TaxID=502051 RepID=UPI00166AD2B7|nr:MSHA biogenesis protein MshI [Bowmanella pacifica]
MLTSSWRKSTAYFSVGLEFGQHGVMLSLLGLKEGQPYWLDQHKMDSHDWVAALTLWVENHRAANTPCHLVFSTNRYQLLQVDRPPVPELEIVPALSWSVRELLATQDEMQVDYFDMPAQPTGTNKINVVAVPKSLVEDVVQGIAKAGLQLATIGIEELSQCDLLEPHQDAQITLLQEPGEAISLNIIKDSKLYFTRRLRGYEQLSSYGLEQIHQGVADSLSLEIQRSMDYFDSQLRQAPVRKLLLCIDTPFMAELAQLLQEATLLDTQIIEPNLAHADGLSFSSGSLTSLGAAMRQQRGTGE